jgi:predicted DNA-binding protein (MmcQ/YjbR family)
MAKRPTILDEMREICLSLPDTRETLTWGKPHFRVGDKIFAGCDEVHGNPTIGFKLEMDHAAAIIGDPRFERAPYVGHKGWVSMDVTDVRDWNEVRPLLLESYRLIAPKRSLAKLGEARPLAKAPARRVPKTATPRAAKPRRPAASKRPSTTRSARPRSAGRAKSRRR